MHTRNILVALALSTGLIAGGTAFAEPAKPPVETGNWMSIPQVYNKLTADGYRDIVKIERERRGYKVRAFNREGQRVKLDVDPVNGEILKMGARTERCTDFPEQRSNRDRGNERYRR